MLLLGVHVWCMKEVWLFFHCSLFLEPKQAQGLREGAEVIHCCIILHWIVFYYTFYIYNVLACCTIVIAWCLWIMWLAWRIPTVGSAPASLHEEWAAAHPSRSPLSVDFCWRPPSARPTSHRTESLNVVCSRQVLPASLSRLQELIASIADESRTFSKVLWLSYGVSLALTGPCV